MANSYSRRFFRASASKASIHAQAQREQALERIEQDIEHYLGQLNDADRGDGEPGLASLAEDTELAAQLEALQQRQRHQQQVLKELERTGESQYSTTDPDARLLSKRGHTVAGYNVQHTVDAKHKLSVDHEVTHDGNDAQQLAPMALRAQQVLAVEELTATADSGYYQGEHLKTCLEHGITPFVAVPDKNKAIAQQGRYTRDRFTFEPEHNRYRCPAGQCLEQQGQPYDKNGRTQRAIWSSITSRLIDILRIKKHIQETSPILFSQITIKPVRNMFARLCQIEFDTP